MPPPPPPPPNKKKEMNNNNNKKSSPSIMEVDLVLATLVMAVEEEVPCNSNNSNNSKSMSMMSMITGEKKKKTASREKIVDKVRVSRMKAMGRFDGILVWGVELEIIGDWGVCLISFLFFFFFLWVDAMDGCDGWLDGLDE